jgi:hypothetical protein
MRWAVRSRRSVTGSTRTREHDLKQLTLKTWYAVPKRGGMFAYLTTRDTVPEAQLLFLEPLDPIARYPVDASPDPGFPWPYWLLSVTDGRIRERPRDTGAGLLERGLYTIETGLTWRDLRLVQDIGPARIRHLLSLISIAKRHSATIFLGARALEWLGRLSELVEKLDQQHQGLVSLSAVMTKTAAFARARARNDFERRIAIAALALAKAGYWEQEGNESGRLVYLSEAIAHAQWLSTWTPRR